MGSAPGSDTLGVSPGNAELGLNTKDSFATRLFANSLKGCIAVVLTSGIRAHILDLDATPQHHIKD